MRKKQDKPATVPMFNPDTGKTADVHPDEVENWRRAGWRVVESES
jgi:hypothetical protein